MAYRGSGGLTPFGGLPLFSLRREIDRIFDDAFTGRGAESRREGSSWTPSVNVREGTDGLTLEFELPGIRPEQVDIAVENGVLTVSGEKREERREGEEGGRYHLVERSYGSFTRSFQLPQGIDEGKIEADFENGVLSVRVPKAALPQPRRVQIRAGAGGAQRKPSAGQQAGTQTPTAAGSRGSQQESGRTGSGARARSPQGDEHRAESRRAAKGSDEE